MLWDIIRDFFVKYIFGGYDSQMEQYGGFIGRFVDSSSDTFTECFSGDLFVNFVGYDAGLNLGVTGISFGDWLSTTATIITLVALFVGISCLMVSLFRWIVRLVSLRG